MENRMKYVFLSCGTTCHANLISFSDRVTDFLDKENAIGLIFMDFSKAFDIAPHGKLSVGLEAVEISKKNRKVDKKEQQVEMETDSTKREGIKSEGGHPQNSPKTGLDTTLFHISMNDLGKRPMLTEFADSTILKSAAAQELARLSAGNLGLE